MGENQRHSIELVDGILKVLQNVGKFLQALIYNADILHIRGRGKILFIQHRIRNFRIDSHQRDIAQE